MGNCQAAEAATVVVQHPGGKRVERFYWAVSAHEVMTSNPGHYVALVITSSPVNQLKLLRPDDTLLIGQVYRLITFEDVLKEFAAKKSEKLGKLLKESGALHLDQNKTRPRTNPNSNSRLSNGSSTEMRQELLGLGSSTNCSRGVGRHRVGAQQWRPSLQSIAEFGT